MKKSNPVKCSICGSLMPYTAKANVLERQIHGATITDGAGDICASCTRTVYPLPHSEYTQITT